MPRYPNGQIPEDQLIVLGTGSDRDGTWYHLAPPGTAARWRWMVNAAYLKYGVTLRITPGWNLYRPLHMQVIYRKRLGVMAAVPGTSSHGGVYNGRDCMAVDVNNWSALAPGNESLAWSRFVALCRLAGFTVDFVTPRELWHIGDFDPWNIPNLEEDMPSLSDIFNTPVTKQPGGSDVSLAQAITELWRLGNMIYDQTPGRVWDYRLDHTVARDDAGNPVRVPAGDLLRYEPAEHETTRRAVAAVATGDLDYDKVASEIAERFPGLDPHAFAIAAADEADRRERARLNIK